MRGIDFGNGLGGRREERTENAIEDERESRSTRIMLYDKHSLT